ncbi:uncharacterized protein DS421_10g311100 [Arachis hypogaea]|nr:uncharacterized protein DS421_10g311100 [Arachis hypogaea]
MTSFKILPLTPHPSPLTISSLNVTFLLKLSSLICHCGSVALARTSSLPLSAPVSLLSLKSHTSLSSLFVSSLITISHQSRSCTFPALVGGGGRSSRSQDWSSSSLPVSSPSHTQSCAFVAIVVLVAASGRSSRSRD